MNDNTVYRRKFGTIGRKEVVFDGEYLSIKSRVIELEDIECVYVRRPTDSRIGTVHFSLDGEDIGDLAVMNKDSFMYAGYQQKYVNELLDTLGLKVINVEEVKKIKKKTPKQEKKEHLKTLKKEGVPYCPKCKSTSLQYVERRKQLSVGRGVVGSIIGGMAGAPLAGAVGAVTSKKYKGKIKCLNCGKSWKK